MDQAALSGSAAYHVGCWMGGRPDLLSALPPLALRKLFYPAAAGKLATPLVLSLHFGSRDAFGR